MKLTALLAVSLVCLTTGAAFAEGDGGFGLPQSPNSLPSGFVTGTAAPNDTTATLPYGTEQTITTDTAWLANMQVASSGN